MSHPGSGIPEEVCRRLADSLPGAVWIISLAQDPPELLYSNLGGGLPVKALVAGLCGDAAALARTVHPDDLASLTDLWERVRRGEQGLAELRLMAPEGTVLWTRIQVWPLDPEKAPPRLVAGLCQNASAGSRPSPPDAASGGEAALNAALADISQAVIHSAPPDQLCRLVLAKARELTQSDGGLAAYYDQHTRQMVVPAQGAIPLGPGSGSPEEKVDWPRSAWWARCLATRQSRFLNEPRPAAGQGEQSGSHARLLCVPAVFGDRLLGQIALTSQRRDYTQRDLELVERLSSLFAIALERHKREEDLRASEARLRSLVEAISDLVWETNAEGRLIYVSPNLTALLGYRPEEVLGKTFLELLTPEEAERVGDFLGPILETRKPYVYVGKTILHKCGKPVVLESSGVPIVDSQGHFWGYRGLDRDITERHRAAETLYREKEKYRLLVEESPLGVAIIGAQGAYKYVNPKFVEIFGYTLEDIPTGRHWFDLAFPDPEHRRNVIATWKEDLEAVPAGGIRARSFPVTCKDGSHKIINFRPVTLITGDQLVTYEDVTERRQAEEALRQSEAKHRLLVSNIPAVVFRGYADWSVEFFDDKVTELTGYARAEFISRRLKWSDLIVSEDKAESQRIFQEALRGSGAYVRQYRIRHRDGHLLWLESRGQIVKDENNRIDHIYGVFFDITKQKQVEQALAEEKERLQVTLRSIGDGVIATDNDGRVVLMNQVAEALTGWTQAEARHRPVSEVLVLVHELSRKPLANPEPGVIKTGRMVKLPANTLLLGRDGSECLLEASAAPIIDQEGQAIGAVLVFRDVTLKRQTEAELLKMEKLSSLGILAGGIAHDFNNILTGILGNLSLSLLSAPRQGQLYRRLAEAEQATLRARDLVQQLLTFAKGGAPVKEVASLEEIIRESATFACRGSQVRCLFNFPKDLWPAAVDPGQVSQVIQNLAINSIQAMPTGGELAITAKNVTLRENRGLPLATGKYLKITLTDQGIGIPPEHLAKIFDPYFSTKQKGSGLGLATVYSIMKNHDGYVTVESSLGLGTSFHLYLPASTQGSRTSPRIKTNRLHKGQGRILVMDDDAGVRQVARKILKHLGYEAVCAGDGAEAIATFREALSQGAPFDLVIMDLTIPGGMGGKEALQALLEIAPQTRAIVSSGYADDPIMTHYQQYGFKGVIKKPYKVETFSQVLHEVLECQES